MATEEITPRTLIQGFIEVSSVSKSTATTSRMRARRSNTGSRVTALRKDEIKRRSRSVSDLTPRTLIQGVLKNNEIEQPPPTKRARTSTPATTVPRAKVPGTLPHSTARRRVTRLEALATPGADPTPRSLIQGLIGTAAVETPAVHFRRSSTLRSADFPDVDEAIQGRANSDTLSPLIREPTGTANRSSRPPPSNLRKRQPISSVDFAAGVRERLSRKQDSGAEEGNEEADKVVDDVDFMGGIGEGVAAGIAEDVEGRSEPSISEDEDAGMIGDAVHQEDAKHQEDGEERGDDEDEEGERSEEIADAHEEEACDQDEEEAGDQDEEDLDEEEAHSDSAISPAPAPGSTPSSSRAPPLADNSVHGSAKKQAADSTWTGRESEASIPSQREGSPGGVRRVPDSTVGDLGSEGGDATLSDQPMDSELSLDAQQTVAESQSRLSAFSPLVTPRLPSGRGRPTPALKKTPAHLRQQAAEREWASTAAPKRAPQRTKRPAAPRKDTPCLPTSLTKSILAHFSKARVSKEAVTAVEKGAEVFFKRLSNDLTAYSHHGHRQTIEQSDVELLMKRQGLIKDQQSMYALIEKYLPLEYRQELIPMATAGNKVTPKSSH